MRKIGEGAMSGEEDEWEMLNGIVNDREAKAREKRAAKAKVQRMEMKKVKAPAL